MTAVVVALVIASVGSYLLKLAGVSLPESVLPESVLPESVLPESVLPESVLADPTVQRIAGFLPVAMLTALVVVGLADGDGDRRWSFDGPVLAGFAAAVVALVLRAGVLVVFVVAVTVTAVLRLLV